MQAKHGIRPKELDEVPDFPTDIGFIWRWYMDMQTLSPLTHSEIRSWSENMHTPLQPDEITLIRELDALYWNAVR